MSQDQGEIYMITNKTTGKRYIGQAVSYLSSGRKYGAFGRWNGHVAASKQTKPTQLISEAICKFGKDDFSIEILVICNLKDLDYYEKKFISVFNTIYPNGYNVAEGGNANKRCSLETRQLISEQKRFLYVSEEDRRKIEKSMKELNIDEIPSGIVYQHNTNIEDYKEGFVVSIDDGKKKSFTIGSLSLTEKLRMAIEYQGYYMNNDKNNLQRMDDEMEERTSQRLSDNKRFKHVSDEDKIRIAKSMNDIGIETLPKGIRYTHNKNRDHFEGFTVIVDNKKTKTFSSARTLTDNLRLALEYQDYFLKNDVENMKRMDEDTKNRHTLRSRYAHYTEEAKNAMRSLNIDFLDMPLEIHYRTIPSSEFFVIHNKKRIFFTFNDHMKSLEECIQYLNTINKTHDAQRGSV